MNLSSFRMLEHDVAQDIITHYLRFLQDGMTDRQASELAESSMEELDAFDDKNIALIALAITQHNWGRVNSRILSDALMAVRAMQNNDSFNGAFSQKEFLAIEELLKSPAPRKMRIRKPDPYRCHWKNGDVYSVPLCYPRVKQAAFIGRHLLFQKVREVAAYPHDILPVVRFKLSPPCTTTHTFEEISQADDLIVSLTRYSMELKEFRDDALWANYSATEALQAFEENRKHLPVDSNGFLHGYQAELMIRSASRWPEHWEYLGNFPLWEAPADEYVFKNDLSLPAFSAFSLEKEVISRHTAIAQRLREF